MTAGKNFECFQFLVRMVATGNMKNEEDISNELVLLGRTDSELAASVDLYKLAAELIKTHGSKQ